MQPKNRDKPVIPAQAGIQCFQIVWISASAGITALFVPALANAHSFGRLYNLPVPFWLYAWGAAAALIASFLVVGYFISSDAETGKPQDSPSIELSSRFLNGLLPLLKLLSAGGLLLCMLTGFIGTRSPYGNFNMTYFWIVFILGFAYLTVVAGDLYAAINPWKLITDATGRIFRSYSAGLLSYPDRLGYWPAIAFYIGFIWIELFGRSEPLPLAVMLATYSAINLLGVGLIGSRAWFQYCEFLSVFFCLIARMAPLEYSAADGDRPARWRLRMPFTGLLDPPAERMSLLVFVLFMLASTAFDGLRETMVWKKFFWLDLYHGFLQHRISSNPLAAFPQMRKLFLLWQSIWLVAAPFLYLAVFLLFVWLMRLVTQSEKPLRELALQFGLTLLPIALVYNITHYYTLIQVQGIKIISLASDPFGWGWNLFGTAGWLQRMIIPDAGTVWHVQVGLIVFGHIVSVYLAHRVALRVFASRRQAIISQVPILFLMVIFTTVGLWILAQPIQSGG